MGICIMKTTFYTLKLGKVNYNVDFICCVVFYENNITAVALIKISALCY